MFRDTKTFEFKRHFTANISIPVTAFLNTNGGMLVMALDGPEFKTVMDVDKAIQRILSRLHNEISNFSDTLISFSSLPIGNAFILIIDVDESSQLHYVTNVQGTQKFFYRQSDRNIGQDKLNAERRRLKEKYGIKIISPAPIDNGTGIFHRIGDYPSGAYYYKYMSLETALKCLQNKSIRFAEPTDWADKYEGHFYKAEIHGAISSTNNPPLLGCCFTYRQDNEAAWKLYSYEKKGLNSRCVEFKLDRNKLREQIFNSLLKTSTKNNQFFLFEGCVDYWDPQKIENLHKQRITRNHKKVPNEYYNAFFNGFSLEKYLNLMLIKRNAFLHEQEVRFLLVPEVYSKYTKTKIAPIGISIDWSQVILEVRVDANCSKYEQDLLAKALTSIGSSAPLKPFNVYDTKNPARVKV